MRDPDRALELRLVDLFDLEHGRVGVAQVGVAHAIAAEIDGVVAQADSGRAGCACLVIKPFWRRALEADVGEARAFHGHAISGGGRRIVILVQGDVGVRTFENGRACGRCAVRACAECVARDGVQAHGARIEVHCGAEVAHGDRDVMNTADRVDGLRRCARSVTLSLMELSSVAIANRGSGTGLRTWGRLPPARRTAFEPFSSAGRVRWCGVSVGRAGARVVYRVYGLLRIGGAPEAAVFEKSWCENVVAHFERRGVRSNGRVRFWARVPEAGGGRSLRLLPREDGRPIHNAFPDRGFKP